MMITQALHQDEPPTRLPAPGVESTITILRRARLLMCDGAARLALTSDCCDLCTEAHAPGCGLRQALALLPSYAVLDSSHYEPENDQEVQVWTW